MKENTPVHKPKIYIEVLDGGSLPHRASVEAAGYDLTASKPCRIMPGSTGLITTGIKIALPLGYEAQIRPRSGLALKTSLRIPNSPGTIDSDYRDEIKIIIHNQFLFSSLPDLLLQKPELLDYLQQQCRKSSYLAFLSATSGKKQSHNLIQDFDIWLEEDGLPFGTIRINQGDRVAQMVISKSFSVEFELCDNLGSVRSNRGGGFGSTGEN
ncbi:MAG: dUTP diphosphatase [Saccharofermentanales bacterium]|jgi:dUTP pyrophosphatase